MRALVIILAVIGGFAVTSVAGCVGCVSCALLLAKGATPQHFTGEQIRAHYGPVIATVSAAAAAGTALNHRELSSELGETDHGLVAIFAQNTSDSSSTVFTHDVYARYTIEHHGHNLWNGVGAVTLTVNGQRQSCAAYTISHQGQEWVLALRDWMPESAEE